MSTPTGPVTQGRRFERTVAPEQETLISLQVEPHCACDLFHPARPEGRLRLDSDEQGIVRFHLRIPREATGLELQLAHAGKEGNTQVHTVAISADPYCWGDALRTALPAAPPKTALRPALESYPQGISNKALVERGYPPQPHPQRSPRAHRRWRQLVSQPYATVNPFRAPREDSRFGAGYGSGDVMSPTLPLPPPGPELKQALKLLRRSFPGARQWERSFYNSNSSNWSGVAIQQPVNNFFLVQGDWRVPRVSPAPESILRSEAAMWVGLGNGPTDLFQAGTDSVSVNFPVGLDGSLFATATNYWMWIQVLPFAPWAVPNFPLSPDDQISVNIHVADQNNNTWFRYDNEGGGLTAQDNSVWFMLYNRTKSLSYWGTVPTSTPADQFNGNTVEFIIERPSNGSGGTWDLANFGTARMQNCAYGDAQFGYLQEFAPTPDDGSQPFSGSLSYLNMINPANNRRLATAISCPDASGFGGNDIFWLWSSFE